VQIYFRLKSKHKQKDEQREHIHTKHKPRQRVSFRQLSKLVNTSICKELGPIIIFIIVSNFIDIETSNRGRGS
jgi:hypothetical protein